MLKNYFITAFRNLIRNRVYTALNIIGLTIGVTCFVIVAIYVENELSHDAFHENESYRFLLNEGTGDGDVRTYGLVGINTYNTIEEQISGVEDILLARKHGAGPLLLEYDDVSFKTRDLFFSEPEFFDYFDFDLIQGNPETALSDPNNVVITASMAERIFGDSDPMGEIIKFSGSMNFTLQVTGIVEDIKNSHLDFDFLVNFDLRDELNDYIIMREGYGSVYGYFKLAPNVKASRITDQIKSYYEDFYKDRPETLALLDRESYELQSVYDIYFGSNKVVFDEDFKKGDKQNLILLSAIGFLILLIACMNYINAATAKAVNRTKEIGVRKVFGAYRKQLFTQFIGEAFLVTLASVLLSALMIDLSIPWFQRLMETEFRYDLLSNPIYFQSLILVLALVTFLSGTYPALIMSSFKTSESLKPSQAGGILKGNSFRSILVGLQLFFAVVLISSVLLILEQKEFISQKDLGFSKEDILIVPNNSPKVADQLSTYRTELLKSPYIYGATSGMDVLGFGKTNHSGLVVLEGQNRETAPVASYFTIGLDFLDIQGFEIKNGRAFNKELASDSSTILVNESYLKTVGLSGEEIIGKKARLFGPDTEPLTIIGVVQDFNFKSLRSKVSPTVFRVSKGTNWFWTIKIDPEHKKEAVSHVRNTWEAIEDQYPFGYWFLEDSLQDFYTEESRLEGAIKGFSLICIIISCLGLYGMTAFTIERRIKEIGIRKVLGAQVQQLVWLVNQKFIKLFILAFLISIPLVYYAINQWLEGFAYHIEIGAQSFVLAGVFVLLIILITVSIQAIKAALSNPAKTLRTE